MAQTEGEIEGDDPDEISARRWFVEGLLTTIPPHDTAEVAHVIDAVKGGLIDIGSVDDGGRHAEVFEHLLRSVARLG